jgi:Uma2 family endonuclease
MIIAGDPIYQGKGTTTVINPTVIVEVLSASTQDYDRGTKFTYYRAIPELREYVLINQSEYAVEQFSKNEEGKWVLTEEKGDSGSLNLPSLNLAIAFGEIYEKINFNTYL